MPADTLAAAFLASFWPATPPIATAQLVELFLHGALHSEPS
jgi:hypothetical protein